MVKENDLLEHNRKLLAELAQLIWIAAPPEKLNQIIDVLIMMNNELDTMVGEGGKIKRAVFL